MAKSTETYALTLGAKIAHTMSCYCAMIHRRHLMVWAIFAPKVSSYVSVLFAIFFVLICSRTGLCSEHFSFSFLFYSSFFYFISIICCFILYYFILFYFIFHTIYYFLFTFEFSSNFSFLL